MFPQILLYVVTFFLFVTTGIAQARAEWQDESSPTRPALRAVAEWISENASLPMIEEMPAVVLVPLPQLTRLRDNGLMLFYAGFAPTAGYDDKTGTIYLPEGWTGQSPTEQSVLVHEMVHHMQNQAGFKYACDDARAEPAYLAQEKWLQKYGLTLKHEFKVDTLTLESMASCM